MPAKIFGRGMDNDIGTKLNRALQIRRAIGVIDDNFRPMFMGNLGNRFDIDQTHVRVGRGFEIDNLGLVGNRLFKLRRVGQINMGVLDAKLFQTMTEIGKCAAIQRAIDNDLIPRRNEGPEHRRDRAHARCSRNRSFAALKNRQTFFQQIKRRVGNPRIDKALLVPGKEPPTLLCGFKGKGRGHINRLVQRPVVTLRVITMMNGTGGETGFGIGFKVCRHGGLPRLRLLCRHTRKACARWSKVPISGIFPQNALSLSVNNSLQTITHQN